MEFAVQYKGVWYTYDSDNGGSWVVSDKQVGGTIGRYPADHNTIDQSIEKFKQEFGTEGFEGYIPAIHKHGNTIDYDSNKSYNLDEEV